MSTESQVDIQKELDDQLNRLESLLSPVAINRSGNSTINVNAGSWMGVLLMIASAFVLGFSMATSHSVTTQLAKDELQQSSRMGKIEAKQDEQDQYLHAIYMMAPQLKPKEKTDEHAKSK
jgi:hypothetical protein